LETIPAQLTEDVYAPDLIAQLPALIARVPPASRAVLILHYLHEMPLAEVAAVLDVAQGTVKSRLSYGLNVLRREINARDGVKSES
jgi:RNA polymerase sigma factor (sigma-70 family)